MNKDVTLHYDSLQARETFSVDRDTGLEQPSDDRDTEPVHFFRQRILAWGAEYGRQFPWRETTDPYQVLIAEMMLRRTQARQVVPVYLAFLERFPIVEDLAASSEEEVTKLLWPLGLAWRAANFRRMAQQVVEQERGSIPHERERLLKLTGVGDYVASAVRCMAFRETEPLVDTNTVRVAGRYFGFSTHPESRRDRMVRAAVVQLIDPAHPRESNLALLDFASQICRAPRPLCEECPMTIHCAWFKTSHAVNGVHSGGEHGRDPNIQAD